MAGQEGKELPDVAAVGDERVLGEPLLGAEVSDPFGGGLGEARRGGDEESGFVTHAGQLTPQQVAGA